LVSYTYTRHRTIIYGHVRSFQVVEYAMVRIPLKLIQALGRRGYHPFYGSSHAANTPASAEAPTHNSQEQYYSKIIPETSKSLPVPVTANYDLTL
jgi:hypothetical protein